MNYNQLIPIQNINNEHFQALLLQEHHISLCNIDLVEGTLEKSQNLKIEYDEIVLNRLHNEAYMCKFDTHRQQLHFHHIHFEDFSKLKTVTMNLSQYFTSDEMCSSTLYSKLVYVGPNHLLYFITRRPIQFGRPFYQAIFLVNIETSKLIKLDPTLPNGDTLLRLDSIYTIHLHNNESQLLFKTGRIRAYEKKSMYKDKYNKYFEHDNDESLYLFSSNSFITNPSFGQGKALEILDNSCATDKIRIENTTISYVLSDFKDSTMVLVRRDVLQESSSTFTDHQMIQEHLNYELEVEPNYYCYVADLFKKEKNKSFILIDREFQFNLNLREV